jgi:hypothetical protein
MKGKNNTRRETTKKLENKVEEIQKAAVKELNVTAGEISSDHHGFWEYKGVERTVIDEAKKLDDPEPKTKKVKGRGSKKVVVTERIKGVETFTTTAALQEGLSIVRPLGGGKFEIINLQSLPLSSLNTKGAGLHLNTDVTRANAFYLRGDQWVNAITKCAFAARYAGKIYSVWHLLVEIQLIFLQISTSFLSNSFPSSCDPSFTSLSSALQMVLDLHASGA